MIILSIRTDKPEAEVGLYKDSVQLAYETWTAHRALAETLHSKVQAILTVQSLEMSDLEGIAVFRGPGSFTGLRIGLTVANAIAYAAELPVVAQMGEIWQRKAIERLMAHENDRIAFPEYGADVHITTPKH